MSCPPSQTRAWARNDLISVPQQPASKTRIQQRTLHKQAAVCLSGVFDYHAQRGAVMLLMIR
jgi:hypothetical protein